MPNIANSLFKPLCSHRGPDAETFKPERWLDEGAAAAIHPGQYMPFSRGPRDCIGQTFAVLVRQGLLPCALRCPSCLRMHLVSHRACMHSDGQAFVC